jgi:hypothetical protein
LSQCPFIHSTGTCRCERLVFATPAPYLIALRRCDNSAGKAAAFPTDRFVACEYLCRAPTLFAGDTQRSSFNARTTNQASLGIDETKCGVVEQAGSVREEHTSQTCEERKTNGLQDESGRPQLCHARYCRATPRLRQEGHVRVSPGSERSDAPMGLRPTFYPAIPHHSARIWHSHPLLSFPGPHRSN